MIIPHGEVGICKWDIWINTHMNVPQSSSPKKHGPIQDFHTLIRPSIGQIEMVLMAIVS